MINYIGLFGMSCISAYIFNVFMETLYPRKYDNRRMYWLAYLAYIMISFGIGIFKIPYVNVICTVLGMGMINGTLYHVKGRNPVINFILFFIYIIAVDTIISVLFSFCISRSGYMTSYDDVIYLTSGIVNALLLICTHKKIIQFLKNNPISKSSIALSIYMIFLLGFETAVISYFVKIQFHTVPFLGISIGFVIVDIGILYLYKMISRITYLEKQTELLSQQKAATNKFYHESEKRYEAAQKLLHDFKKHLQVVESLANESYSNNQAYIENLAETIKSLEQKFQCSNKIINVIIWEKMQQCERLNINFNISMQDIDWDFMSDMELTSLFANLLDNSIEACEDSVAVKKDIDLRIHKYKKFIVINLMNSIGQRPVIKNRKPVSTKPGHKGLGMLILEEIVKKYDGDLNFDYTEEFFITKINIRDCRDS
ncbi:sensor histidine kinase [[Clostridium] scindens]|uniref:sensor histidine kinase n=1 Tax=Clostridium scindens (strain JCM 10418 / VPI 12708) TaxID=29347 RepID=UPI0026EAF6EE|nr:sensor histidine kinase [[Clostridium] scindens]